MGQRAEAGDQRRERSARQGGSVARVTHSHARSEPERSVGEKGKESLLQVERDAPKNGLAQVRQQEQAWTRGPPPPALAPRAAPHFKHCTRSAVESKEIKACKKKKGEKKETVLVLKNQRGLLLTTLDANVAPECRRRGGGNGPGASRLPIEEGEGVRAC